MSEWLKEHAWKVCVGLKPTEGSNPSLSAKDFLSIRDGISFFNHIFAIYKYAMKKYIIAAAIAIGSFSAISQQRPRVIINGDTIFVKDGMSIKETIDHAVDSINDMHARAYLKYRQEYEDSVDKAETVALENFLRNSPHLYWKEYKGQHFCEKERNPENWKLLIEDFALKPDTLENYPGMSRDVLGSINRIRKEAGFDSVAVDSVAAYEFSEACIGYNFSAALVKDFHESCEQGCSRRVVQEMMSRRKMRKLVFSEGLDWMKISIIRKVSYCERNEYAFAFVEYGYFGLSKKCSFYIPIE